MNPSKLNLSRGGGQCFFNRSSNRHQDRHLMTASRSCKSARYARWLATGHGRARPDIRQPSQIIPSNNSLHRLDSNQSDRPRHPNPHSACRTALRSLKRGFLPWRLSDAGHRIRGAVTQAAGIRNPSQERTTCCRGSECSCKKRSISLVASGPRGSASAPAGLPREDQAPDRTAIARSS